MPNTVVPARRARERNAARGSFRHRGNKAGPSTLLTRGRAALLLTALILAAAGRAQARWSASPLRPGRVVSSVALASQVGGPRWQEGFAGPDLDGPAKTMMQWDDGTGPALYVGGSFTNAAGLVVHGIARWDGSEWAALASPSGTGVDGEVDALAVYDDGSGPELYVGGRFSSAAGSRRTRSLAGTATSGRL